MTLPFSRVQYKAKLFSCIQISSPAQQVLSFMYHLFVPMDLLPNSQFFQTSFALLNFYIPPLLYHSQWKNLQEVVWCEVMMGPNCLSPWTNYLTSLYFSSLIYKVMILEPTYRLLRGLCQLICVKCLGWT